MAAAACERIKSTPTPRQYDFFTRVAVIVFATLLPFGLESVILPGQWWWVVLLSVAISGVFIVLERVGAVIDTPFREPDHRRRLDVHHDRHRTGPA